MKSSSLPASLLLVALSVWLLRPPAAAAPPSSLVNQRDGSVLMRIPAGPFRMGSSVDVARAQYEIGVKKVSSLTLNDLLIETPAHTAQTKGYYLARCEVSNAQFARFVAATGYDAGPAWKAAAREWGEQGPVLAVSALDAEAYCRWAGLRLPTEVEWEKAARGTDARVFPWGNHFDLHLCASSVEAGRFGAGTPHPVGSFTAGASPYGCLDMCGNAAEWTATDLAPYPDASLTAFSPYTQANRVARGGSWRDPTPVFLRCADRWWQRPTSRVSGLGFRCARDE